MHAVGLNFRDVLIVLGEYPGDPGIVAAGTDVAGTAGAPRQRRHCAGPHGALKGRAAWTPPHPI